MGLLWVWCSGPRMDGRLALDRRPLVSEVCVVGVKSWAAYGDFGGSDFRLDDIGEVREPTPSEVHQARLQVAGAAYDAADAFDLMEALGIAPGQEN